MSFALEHEIVTFAWINNASVQFPLNIYATKGSRPVACFENTCHQSPVAMRRLSWFAGNYSGG